MLVLSLLGLSLIALAVAPWLMPASYDWIDHTTSESGAQTIPYAWVARLGFAAWGLAALILTRGLSGWAERAPIAVFGGAMLGAAAFSTRPWTGQPFDPLSDQLHTLFASAMGMAFIVVVALRMARARRWSWVDVLALATATLLPAIMALWPQVAGLAQRIMFVAAYGWFAQVALDSPDIDRGG